MIGVSLAPGLFHPETASEAVRLLSSQAGGCRRLLKALKAAGVSSVELRTVPGNMPPDLVAEMADRIADCGMGFTVHCGIRNPQTACEGILRPLEKVLDRAPVVTVHALADEDETALALQNILSESTPLRIALENSRKLPGGEYGDSKPMIARIVKAVNHPRLGICWDMGHDWFNVLRTHGDGKTILPPSVFLDRVIHTHIHGVVNSQTHFPPDDENLPLQSWCGALPKGVLWNLELEPERYFDIIPPFPALMGSVERLADIRPCANGQES